MDVIKNVADKYNVTTPAKYALEVDLTVKYFLIPWDNTFAMMKMERR